jgi:hypothetical protein
MSHKMKRGTIFKIIKGVTCVQTTPLVAAVYNYSLSKASALSLINFIVSSLPCQLVNGHYYIRLFYRSYSAARYRRQPWLTICHVTFLTRVSDDIIRPTTGRSMASHEYCIAVLRFSVGPVAVWSILLPFRSAE